MLMWGNKQTGKEIFRRDDESRKANVEYRRLNVGFVSWAGFSSTCLRVKFRSAKSFKHKVQYWYECWHLNRSCCLNGSWEAVDKKALGLLKSEQWGDFYVKSEERSPEDYRFNRCKISSVEILDSRIFSPLKGINNSNPSAIPSSRNLRTRAKNSSLAEVQKGACVQALNLARPCMRKLPWFSLRVHTACHINQDNSFSWGAPTHWLKMHSGSLVHCVNLNVRT